MIDAARVERAATVLDRARRARRLLDAMPEDCRPRSLEEGYAVQDRLFEKLAEPAAGWFIGCTNVEVQRQLGLDAPYGARLLASTVHPSPHRFEAPRGFDVVLEVEFAFRFTRALAPRAGGHSRDEVEAAVATVHPSIEVVMSHLRDWTNQDIASLVADNGTDGALIHGEGAALDGLGSLAAVAVTLSVDGKAAQRGVGANALGDPLAALTWLVNHAGARGATIDPGQIHNTGTCTPMHFATRGERAVARFEGLGEVAVTMG